MVREVEEDIEEREGNKQRMTCITYTSLRTSLGIEVVGGVLSMSQTTNTLLFTSPCTCICLCLFAQHSYIHFYLVIFIYLYVIYLFICFRLLRFFFLWIHLYIFLQSRDFLAAISFMGISCRLTSLPDPDHSFHEWDTLDMVMMMMRSP